MNVLRNDTLICTEKRLFLLIMLNISDWLCTLSLISTGAFEEAKKQKKNIIARPIAGAAVKVFFPIVFALFALIKAREADRQQLLVSNNIAFFGVIVYVVINIYHLVCFALLFILKSQ